MLDLRPTCENCNKSLPPNSVEAMICSYECTFCRDCVDQILENVCPNCGGGFERRPIRPKDELSQNPAKEKVVFKPIDLSSFQIFLKKFKSVPPEER